MKLMTRIVSIAGAAVAALSLTVPAASAGTAVRTTAGIQVTPLTSSGPWSYVSSGNDFVDLTGGGFLGIAGGPHGSRTYLTSSGMGVNTEFEEVGVGSGYFQIEDKVHGTCLTNNNSLAYWESCASAQSNHWFHGADGLLINQQLESQGKFDELSVGLCNDSSSQNVSISGLGTANCGTSWLRFSGS
jgi:hypothetical protein